MDNIVLVTFAIISDWHRVICSPIISIYNEFVLVAHLALDREVLREDPSATFSLQVISSYGPTIEFTCNTNILSKVV